MKNRLSKGKTRITKRIQKNTPIKEVLKLKKIYTPIKQGKRASTFIPNAHDRENNTQRIVRIKKKTHEGKIMKN